MKSIRDWDCCLEPWARADARQGRTASHQATEVRVHFARHSLILPLHCGNGDCVRVFEDDSVFSRRAVVVLTYSRRLDYAGIEVFDRLTGDPLGERFAQSEADKLEAFGPRGLDLEDVNLARRLLYWGEE